MIKNYDFFLIFSKVSCWSEKQILTNCTHGQSDPSTYCMYPSYFTYFMVLALIATSMLTQLSHFTKATILFVITLMHCVVNVVTVGTAIDCEDSIIYKPFKYDYNIPNYVPY